MFATLKFITSHPLNRDHKCAAIVRYAKWQLGSRMIGGTAVYDWIRGARFLVRAGETGLTGNIYTGLHEFADMGFLLHMLRPTDLFVDVGANAGSYTLLACAVVQASGVAFEPVPETYARLVDNTRLNHLDARVRTVNMAIGDRKSRIAFTSDGDTVNHAVAAHERVDGTVEVEVTTLDDALQDQSPALIKIDVEGYETPVLGGGASHAGQPRAARGDHGVERQRQPVRIRRAEAAGRDGRARIRHVRIRSVDAHADGLARQEPCIRKHLVHTR